MFLFSIIFSLWKAKWIVVFIYLIWRNRNVLRKNCACSENCIRSNLATSRYSCTHPNKGIISNLRSLNICVWSNEHSIANSCFLIWFLCLHISKILDHSLLSNFNRTDFSSKSCTIPNRWLLLCYNISKNSRIWGNKSALGIKKRSHLQTMNNIIIFSKKQTNKFYRNNRWSFLINSKSSEWWNKAIIRRVRLLNTQSLES